ncbi:hypothetical protein CALVIDRAFT_216366 [Calocera viscosa TUFC12733]|uniref:Uncharacterized protein n=1 Tax=Calocera viscosa (strain TUFC12733) TaxID=1330018 RepID=A0A167RGI2_CALVF|nr:hypothetical protein CALVIDRAFT_216366 [Calocera viscosa TUFC12733]
MSSHAFSLHIMADRAHDQLLRLCIEACSAMPTLPRAHYIPHMPLLAAHTIIEQLIPAYPVGGSCVHKIELAMLKLIRSSLFHLVSMQINAASAAPFDFHLKLSRDGSDDIIPALLASSVCKVTHIRADTLREVLWHYLGAAPVNLRFRARCDPGTDDGVLRIPPAAFVQLDILTAHGAVTETKRFFSAGIEEENWTFEQWEMAKGLKTPYEDVWEMMPDNLLEKLNTPVDEDLLLEEASQPLSLDFNWPPRPHWSSLPAEPPVAAAGRTTPAPPALSRCSTRMTDSTLATPSAFSELATPSASPFVECGKAMLYPPPMSDRSQSVIIKAAKGSRIHHRRWTGVPIQRYEGGNVFVRGSGLYLGLPEKSEECVDYFWTLEEDIEYSEVGCETREATALPAIDDTKDDAPGWVRARQAALPPRLGGQTQAPPENTSRLNAMAPRFQPVIGLGLQQEKKETDFPAFHLSFPAPEQTEKIATRPVSDLLYPLTIPESRSVSPFSSAECPSVTTATTDPSSRLSPCSSTTSLASTGSKKRRGKRGGKQLRERKERAMAEKMVVGTWSYYEGSMGLTSSASDRTIIAH